MRNKKTAAYLCMGLLLAAVTGCGNSGADRKTPEAETIHFGAAAADEKPEEGGGNQESDFPAADEKPGEGSSNQESDFPAAADEKLGEGGLKENLSLAEDDFQLSGDVRSIGDNRVVVSKIYHYTSNDADYAVSYVGDDPEVVLITVYFSEDTQFEVHTVKNGGVNGEDDVEIREGAFSDIREGGTINLSGGYKGEDFYADKVVIYNFV